MARKPMRHILYAAVAILVAALALIAIRPATAAVPVRIMPLGDSITAGPGCWRAYLWDQLQRTGYTNIDFVGTQPGGGCSVPFDGDHEGHGGYAATGIANQNQLPPWLAATQPDIVMMHLGTNDTWGGHIPLSDKITAFTKLVGQMRAQNPNMKILVAQIIPMEPPGCATCPGDVVALNNAIVGWAAGLTTAQSPIIVVDQWTGFSAAADTNDGVHPIDSGFRKMADRWYPALAAAIGGTTPTTPPTTRATTPPTTRATTPPTTRPTTPPTTRATTPPTTRATTPPTTTVPTGGGACTATYKLVNQWSGGFQADVTVRNGTAAQTSSWTATLAFPNGQQITQIWNASATPGSPIVTRNLSWNGSLAPGATAAFGFLGSWSGTNGAPTVTCTVS